MNIFEFLKSVKAIKNDSKLNSDYVRALHPLGFLYLIITFIILPIYCMFSEDAIQECIRDIIDSKEIRLW